MNSNIIDPNYNWKQAAAQEGVDYAAVRKSFMDQSYGLVANKAKVLFQDPFRLGFEVVHRNEKATKMTGFFAFRVNGAILYAPVFFLNGEIKPADMLYRGDVKRFVPLTDEWCAFLVRGTNQEAGQLVDKNRQRQPDAHMERLAYPQRVKYAAEEVMAKNANDIELEILRHCAEDTEFSPLLPRFISETGPETLEKLAAYIEHSDTAKRYLTQHYTQEQLMCLDGWQSKQAAAVDPEAGHIVLVTGLEVVKSAAEHSAIAERGYALVDNRAPEKASVVEEIDQTSIYDITASGVYDVMTDGGDTERMLVFKSPSGFFRSPSDSYDDSHLRNSTTYVYNIGKKQLMSFWRDNVHLFGNAPVEGQPKVEELGKPISELKVGDVVVIFNPKSMVGAPPVRITASRADGESRVISTCSEYGGMDNDLTYAPERDSNGTFIGDDLRALPVESKDDGRNSLCCPSPSGSRASGFDLVWDTALMSPQGIDKWLRTAGGLTSSVDVTVTSKGLAFDIEHDDGNIKKVARDLGMLEAHLMLANDFEMRCDAAGKLLDKAVDDTVTRVRVFDSQGTKSAFMTRVESMKPWITSTDPELNVRMDTPQRQVLQTHTPQRAGQQSRYGDHWQREPFIPRDPEEDGLPDDALLTQSPEDLASMAEQYQMPQIFDHGVLAQLAKSNFNTINQVQQYIPDLETGVDRYYRVLFLLRYRPADFEEAYGKDELMEMEQELSELSAMAGENLLRLLKRFDAGKFSRQGG